MLTVNSLQSHVFDNEAEKWAVGRGGQSGILPGKVFKEMNPGGLVMRKGKILNICVWRSDAEALLYGHKNSNSFFFFVAPKLVTFDECPESNTYVLPRKPQ